MTNFDDAELAKLFLQAKAAPRLRSHLLMHGGHDDPVQRLVIAARSGSYIRAHRHPEQWEMLAVLKGHLDFLLFTPDGALTERIALRTGHTTVLEIPPGQVHTGVVMRTRPRCWRSSLAPTRRLCSRTGRPRKARRTRPCSWRGRRARTLARAGRGASVRSPPARYGRR